MMKKLLIYSLLFSGILFSSQLHAQTREDCLRFANEAFLDCDYYSAASYYNTLLGYDSSSMEIVFKYAEACRLALDYNKAEKAYLKVVNSNDVSRFPESRFWLALMMKSQGKYKLAESEFATFYELRKNDNSYYSQHALKEIDACKYADSAVHDSLPILITHLSQNVNTPYSEYAPYQLGDTMLQFSSLRPTLTSGVEGIIDMKYSSRLFKSKIFQMGYKPGKEMAKLFNDIKAFNGNSAYSSDYKRMFFTRCEQLNVSRFRCKIYCSEFSNGKWQEPFPLCEKINQKYYTSTQPWVVSDEDGNATLYFSSDKPGGMGGMDLWVSSLDKKCNCSDPVNLGKAINTEDDEITPFFYDSTKTLYFSSTGHKGFGGHDIFKTKKINDVWTPPENLGVPVNSGYNDIYYVINEVDTDGYFASNRPGSLYLKNETCCYDIYSYQWMGKIKKPVLVNVVKKDSVTIAMKIRDLLPIALYFHNDEPDPRTRTTTTDLNYEQTLVKYVKLKDKYKKEYGKGLEGYDKMKAEQDIDKFFNDYVTRGFSKLKLFAYLLRQDMEAGNLVKITVKGYCSPLTTNEYNEKLAKRRISSFVNWLYQYDDGSFVKYMNGTAENGGRLYIIEEPLGEEKADVNVSDNPNDQRNSVFSRAAAMERKIQILYYTSE
ncbi:MAG: hypothetical protein V2A54_04335 [Bacteroidota bacterium]